MDAEKKCLHVSYHATRHVPFAFRCDFFSSISFHILVNFFAQLDCRIIIIFELTKILFPHRKLYLRRSRIICLGSVYIGVPTFFERCTDVVSNYARVRTPIIEELSRPNRPQRKCAPRNVFASVSNY